MKGLQRKNDKSDLNTWVDTQFPTLTLHERAVIQQFQQHIGQQLFSSIDTGFNDGLAGVIARTSVQPDQRPAVSRPITEDDF